MDLMLLRVFQLQVSLQCQFVQRAAHDLDAALTQHDIEAVFYAIQNLLQAAANISKALWGQKGKFAEQRKPVRDSMGVDDASPLKPVSMRNKFEHFDERLDLWWKESQHHNYMDLNVASTDSIRGLDNIDMFRTFDPATANVIFWGERFNIQELVDEVLRILPQSR